MAETTWKAHTEHGELSSSDRNDLPDSVFAFPKQRKEPLTDASHVKNAMPASIRSRAFPTRTAHAFANIKKAADHYGIDVAEKSWHDLGKKPHTNNPAHD